MLRESNHCWSGFGVTDYNKGPGYTESQTVVDPLVEESPSMNATTRRFLVALATAVWVAPLAPLHVADASKPSTPSAVEDKAPASDVLSTGFQNPPPLARPWVYWFWINGNISKEGITADLESFKRVGVGGVLWMEVSGPWWAPDGQVVPLSPQWHEAFQWAVRECERLGIEFDVSLDFGYGSGGPHITPELSMQ